MDEQMNGWAIFALGHHSLRAVGRPMRVNSSESLACCWVIGVVGGEDEQGNELAL